MDDFFFQDTPFLAFQAFSREKIMFEHVYTISPIAYVKVCLCNGASVQNNFELSTAVFWQKIVTFYDEFHDIFHPKHK